MDISNYQLIESMLMTETKFTRKQTRKFKNNRWCKKYEKKYSYSTPRKDFLADHINKVLYVHPIIYNLVKGGIHHPPKFIPTPVIFIPPPDKDSFKVRWRPMFGFNYPIKENSLTNCCVS